MKSSANDSVTKAVRRALLASAALAPAWLLSPQAAAQSPTVNAGPNQVVADPESDGENVQLQGSATRNSSGAGTLTLVWRNAQGVQIATGATPTVRLNPGVNQLTFVASDSGNSSSSSDVVLVTVAGGRTPNNNRVGQHMAVLCPTISVGEGSTGGNFSRGPTSAVGASEKSASSAATLSDLRDRCSVVNGQASIDEQTAAFDAIGAQDFNSIRTQAVVFSQAQFQSIMDRLQSLRAGQRGISLADLTINSGGSSVSGQQIADSLRYAAGGNAAADNSGTEDLFGGRLGLWFRGNVGSGSKDETIADAGFEADQLGLSMGLDYRFNNSFVAGASVGVGRTDIDFNTSRGGYALDSLAGSIYASAYVGNIYLDGVVNYIDSSYDTVRHIDYEEFGASITRTALGETDGSTVSAGLAVGYDFSFGALTVAPSIGYYYVDSSVDAFRENGASGLDLSISDQDYESSTSNIGLRMSYAWKTSWGVILPHFRGQYVREFEDEVAVFNVRFANDPFANSANAAPPIAVESDVVDDSYVRLTAGLSAQFQNDISAYAEYQRLEAFDNVDFYDITIGLRIQFGGR